LCSIEQRLSIAELFALHDRIDVVRSYPSASNSYTNPILRFVTVCFYWTYKPFCWHTGCNSAGRETLDHQAVLRKDAA
jgi:hypothetical protein